MVGGQVVEEHSCSRDATIGGWHYPPFAKCRYFENYVRREVDTLYRQKISEEIEVDTEGSFFEK